MSTLAKTKLAFSVVALGVSATALWMTWPEAAVRSTSVAARSDRPRASAAASTRQSPAPRRFDEVDEPDPPAPLELAPSGERDEPEVLEDPASADAELTTRLTERIDREPADSALAADTRERVQAFFDRDDLQGSHFGDLRCGGTLCRLDVTSDDAPSKERLLASVSDLLPPRAEGFAHVEGPSDLELEIS